MVEKRFFYHSFPRPRQNEAATTTLERGLAILSFMSRVGLILAPEVVRWDVSAVTTNNEELLLLQRRACFTEISEPELPSHADIFGPISLAFEIADLRAVGALPVLYAPQGMENNLVSQLSTFVVHGAWHTEKVLSHLNELKTMTDPENVKARFGHPVSPSYTMHLQNPDEEGRIVADYEIPAEYIRRLMEHVGYRNIPFDHSAAILRLMMNIFYPTDNLYSQQELGYYRQREWRLIESDISFNNRPMTRPLTSEEKGDLGQIDPVFWSRHLSTKDRSGSRVDLALIYQPQPNWNFLTIAKSVTVPEEAIARVNAIVGAELPVRVS
jgi:hypothetical protein